jgi:hypothetical protein
MFLQKTCAICGQTFPETEEHFPISSKRETKDGTTIYFSSYCKACIKVRSRVHNHVKRKSRVSAEDLTRLYGPEELWSSDIKEMTSWPEAKRGRPRRAKLFHT